MEKHSCFVISPIGDAGSATRKEADQLLQIVIKPTLEACGFEVSRGDHQSGSNQIETDTIKAIRESDLCICNLSSPDPDIYNANVYYELGIRVETGKPVILLKSKKLEKLPSDIASRRNIEYAFDPESLETAISALRKDVETLLNNGIDKSVTATTMDDLAMAIQLLDRKIDRLNITSMPPASANSHTATPSEEEDSSLTLREKFRLAIIKKDISKAESILPALELQMDKFEFYDWAVEQTSGIGSRKAGQMLIDFAREFIDSHLSLRKKVEYIGYMITAAGRRNAEEEIVDLVEEICDKLLSEAKNEDPKDIADIYNQKNRLYYGIFINNGDKSWLEKSVEQLMKALEIVETGYLYHNLATCIKKLGDTNTALIYAEKCIELDEQEGDRDADHVEFLCTLYHDTGSPKFEETLEKLREISPGKAELLVHKLK